MRRLQAPGHSAMLDRVNWVVSLLRDPLNPPQQGGPVVDVRAK